MTLNLIIGFYSECDNSEGGIWVIQQEDELYACIETMLLKSTTRHIRIFSAEIQDEQLVPCSDKLTLDVDPDNELNWNNDALQAVYRKFDDLIDASDGEDLTDYNLRRIGSDLEHFVRSLLQNGTISYNLSSRVRNFSMGLPQVDADISVQSLNVRFMTIRLS